MNTLSTMQVSVALAIAMAAGASADPIGSAWFDGEGGLALPKFSAQGAAASQVPAVGRPVSKGKDKDLGEGTIDAATRDRLIRDAAVWEPRDVASVDMLQGPLPFPGMGPGDTVTCTYNQERTKASKMGGGATKKFFCTHESLGLIRVKYTREAPGKTAATRLFWALGFGADPTYAATVKCIGCPDDPWGSFDKQDGQSKPVAADHVATFDMAAVEFRMEKLAGANGGKLTELGEQKDQGWSWKELDNVDPQKPELKVQRDALKLLAAFIQHGDNKAQQQRIVSIRPTGTSFELPAAENVLLYVEDLGATFGGAGAMTGGGASFSFTNWASKCVWKDPAAGIAQLHGSMKGTMSDPQIGEPGRAFLARLLNQLSQDQIKQLFEAARADTEPKNSSKGIGVSDWVASFNLKVKEVNQKTCLTAERDALLAKKGGKDKE